LRRGEEIRRTSGDLRQRRNHSEEGDLVKRGKGQRKTNSSVIEQRMAEKADGAAQKR